VLAQDYAFFELEDEPNIVINAINSGTHKNIGVNIINLSGEEVVIHFPPGGYFLNENESEQNLVLLFYDKLTVPPGGMNNIVLYTACANPDRSAPRAGRINWTYGYDNKMGILLESYESNRDMVALMTGPEHHSTFEKRHNFLQMFVWVYYNADKKQIVNFSTKYIFDGDRDAAQSYVEIYYPITKLFIETYKKL